VAHHVIFDLNAVCRRAMSRDTRGDVERLAAIVALTIEIISGAILPSSIRRPNAQMRPCRPSAISVSIVGELLLHQLGLPPSGRPKLLAVQRVLAGARCMQVLRGAHRAPGRKCRRRARLRQPNGPFRPGHVGQAGRFSGTTTFIPSRFSPGINRRRRKLSFAAESWAPTGLFMPLFKNEAADLVVMRGGFWPTPTKTSAIGAFGNPHLAAGQLVAVRHLLGAGLHCHRGSEPSVGLGSGPKAARPNSPVASFGK